MGDHDGLTRTKLRKVSQEFMRQGGQRALISEAKFATLAELDFSNSPHSICRFMASKLQIEGEDEVKTWWDGVKKHVNDALKRHRNNVIKTIKQLFRDKILGRDGYAVTFELNQIAGMRSPASKERYIDFLDCLVKAVVRYSKYMENRTRQPLSQWFTLTDEAFLMVCIESYMTKCMIGWYREWDLQPQCHLAIVLHNYMRQDTLEKLTERKVGRRKG
ncbi:hypothetical protein MHU86_4040 [Fragilaria crotonensis]|nr:hypothetical protein MHU86_4040 [Fragilaria crotonensis]